MLALQIKQLTKTYRNNMTALHGIDLDIEQGDFFALLGQNGAGKSTTIGIICGLVNKTSGKVRIFDYDIDSDTNLAKSALGIVPQEINFSQFETCLDIVVNQGGYYGIKPSIARQRAEKYLTQLGLWDKRKACSRELSGGMKRRLMIARALVHEPKMLILDEPTAGVDVNLRRATWKFLIDINKQGITILLTTHYLEEAESLCRNMAIIDNGRITENVSMKQFLAKLNKEKFILNLASPLHQLPELADFKAKLIDSTTVEIQVMRQQNINNLFAMLSAQGITVNSMRNKSNRLEKLFLEHLSDNTKAS